MVEKSNKWNEEAPIIKYLLLRRASVVALIGMTLFSSSQCNVDARKNRPYYASHPWTNAFRGGSTTSNAKSDESEAYSLLAKAIRFKLKTKDDPLPEIKNIVKAFKSLSSAQQALKGLDGAAHEAYQRTHTADEVDVSVSGRARRSAARAGATADALGACELCELVENPELCDLSSLNGTLAEREVLLNLTNCIQVGDTNASVLVLYEASYRGGAGVNHGGIEDLTNEEKRASLPLSNNAKGRLLIVIGDTAATSLRQTLKVLDNAPLHVRLNQSLMTNEVASVQPSLYKAAGSVLKELEPILRSYNESAIHFVGRSLAGGIAGLAAAVLDGSIPLPADKKKGQRKKRKGAALNATLSAEAIEIAGNTTLAPLQGLGRGRSSALTLGAPPSMSANVQADFVTSILYGDDVVCRTSKDSLERFLKRTTRALKQGVLARQLGWMTDTMSLAASGVKSHAHGSEGEEARLSVPGRAYLVRPRRLHHVCSIHEVGRQLKGGREALRAAVLWQLNDILLTKSLWKHHQLDAYIHGLDRVQLRGLEDSDDDTFE